MELYFDDIVIQKRKLAEKGCLRLQENAIHILHGKNGCGKTLLLKNIQMNPRNQRFRIVLMDQNNTLLLPTMDILHNIAMTNDERRLEEVKEAVVRLGYEQLLHRKTARLSGGESRLVNMLRCAMSDAEIILIDEPTNDLDYNMVERVLALFQTLRESKTMLIVTHDDRFDAIADGLFVFENGGLRQEEIPQSEVSQTESKDKKADVVSADSGRNADKNAALLKKAFRYDFVVGLLAVLFVLVLCLQATEYKTAANEEIPSLADRQVNLYGFFSQWQNLEEGKGIPAWAVSSLSSINLFEQLEIIGKIEDFFRQDYVEWYDVSPAPSEYYTVYPMEYYIAETNETIFVLEYYLEKYYGASFGEIGLLTEKYFDVPEICSKGQIVCELELEKYLECVEEIEAQKSGVLMAAYLVVNEEYSTERFLHSDVIKEMSGHKCIVASNETYLYQYQLKLLSRMGKEIKVLLLMALVTGISGISACILRLRLSKQTVLVFRNYGFSCDEVLRAAKNKMGNRFALLAVALGYGIWNLLCYRDIPFSQANFLFIFILVLYISLLYKINCLLTEYTVKKYYRWYER